MAQTRANRPEPLMKLRHLEYFVAAAEELNFTHAAGRLHVSRDNGSRRRGKGRGRKHWSGAKLPASRVGTGDSL
jgi:Bacterial regulatory helix-turn-helix protein, lysR family